MNRIFALAVLTGLATASLPTPAVAQIPLQPQESVLYAFQGGSDGAVPGGAVTFDKQGNVYGVTVEGGGSTCAPISICGTVYQLVPPASGQGPWTENVLHVFTGITQTGNDGAGPTGALLLDSKGNLYGTTSYGGNGPCILLGITGGCGTVFKLSPPSSPGGQWTESILYNFQGGTDGYLPSGGVTADAKGDLYGSTQYGGGYGSCNAPFYQYCGTIFELSPPPQSGGSWSEKVLYSFKGGNDGANPNGGLIFDKNGVMYGTTYFGAYSGNGCSAAGGVGCGTAYTLSPISSTTKGAWAEEIIYTFQGIPDGASPVGGLLFGQGGALFGVTESGGLRDGSGTVFELVPSILGPWSENVLYRFSISSGYEPTAGLVSTRGDDLFGTTSVGGANFQGTVFVLRWQPDAGDWQYVILTAFQEGSGAAQPETPLRIDPHGSLFGTSVRYGNTNNGAVYRISP